MIALPQASHSTPLRTAGRLLLLLLALAVTVPSAQADSEDVGELARRHFQAGVAYLQDPDGARYEEAYIEFSAAFAASGSPKVLGNLGLCAMKIERGGEAIDAYRRYLREVSDIDPEERVQIERDLQTLETSVAHVAFVVEPPGAQIVDVRIPVQLAPITNVYGPDESRAALRMLPGHHQIRVELAGYAPALLELDIAPGARETHPVQLVPSAPEPQAAVAEGPQRARDETPFAKRAQLGPWLLTGVGGAALVAGLGSALSASAKVRSLEKRCPQDRCPSSVPLDSEQSKVRRLAAVTDSLLIGGGVLVTAGVSWLLLARRASAHPAVERPVSASAGCLPTGCVGVARFTF